MLSICYSQILIMHLHFSETSSGKLDNPFTSSTTYRSMRRICSLVSTRALTGVMRYDGLNYTGRPQNPSGVDGKGMIAPLPFPRPMLTYEFRVPVQLRYNTCPYYSGQSVGWFWPSLLYPNKITSPCSA